MTGKYFDGKTLFDPGLLTQLDMHSFLRDSYTQAIAEAPVLPGEGAVDQRMRQMSYVNLTRFVQTLLDRKDRMSMAVGLEVRVPFCDHRLVDYAFNIPWAMKAFDGREKASCARRLATCCRSRSASGSRAPTLDAGSGLRAGAT